MRVLVLQRRLSGYFITCLARLLESEITGKVVAWPNQPDAPFSEDVLSASGEVQDRNALSDAELLAMALEFKPDAVLVSGWSDAGYVKVCKALKARGVLIVSGCDTQWKGSFRQHVASVIAPWHVQTFIDVFWVSGERQRQLAAKLGYAGDRCWDGYYSCDWNLFSEIEYRRLDVVDGRSNKGGGGTQMVNEGLAMDTRDANPELRTQKRFVFVGRYAPVKGLDTLAEAYRIYSSKVKSPWALICAGQGDCQSLLLDAGAEDRGFIQPEALPDFLAEADAFILPSRFEPWGVVVQEAAATGLPIIVSDVCGAGVHLLRDRWNGRSFAAGDATHLADCLLWMHQQSHARLIEMGSRSMELSKQYTPERWAQTLIEGVRDLRAVTRDLRPEI